jgi:hypothetical protein
MEGRQMSGINFLQKICPEFSKIPARDGEDIA